jgi:quercetin dioxygenase-like cupin family protein
VKRTNHRHAGLAVVFAVALGVFAASGRADADPGIDLVMTGFDAIAAQGLEWKAAKDIPAGAKMLLIYGSPDKPGPYIFRVMFPAGYKLPAHRHPDQRSVTVLKGTYWSAVGESFEQDKLKKFGPRDLYITAAGAPHFAWAETDVVIQEMGMGPVSQGIEYINTADDPRK